MCKRRLYPKHVVMLLVGTTVVLTLVFVRISDLHLRSTDGKRTHLLTVHEALKDDLKQKEEPQIDLAPHLYVAPLVDKGEEARLLDAFKQGQINAGIESNAFDLRDSSKVVNFMDFKATHGDRNYAAEELGPLITHLNQLEKVQNIDRFPDWSAVPAVIVIQVHTRIAYLKGALDSLQKVDGIEKVLLIISHDFFSDEINELIRLVNFCKVLQIYYPYSLQLYSSKFPGTDPRDCPRDITRVDALKQGCLNAEHPDQYGHYREAKFTVIKHHWWWKANMVFNQLKCTKRYAGPVLLLEEDHYVAPSLLHALGKLQHIRNTVHGCKESCDILTLGAYGNSEDYENLGKELHVTRWYSSKHNMGMVLYRDIWDKIKSKAMDFCTYDDYNWDWSLQYISLTKLSRPLDVLAVKVARVFHVGDCGMHHKDDCDFQTSLRRVNGVIQRQRAHLFTDSFDINVDRSIPHMIRPNGGWGDVRDHDLCVSFVGGDEDIM